MMLRWTKRISIGVVGFIALAVLAGAGFESFMRWQASRQYPVSGKLVDIGGRKLQLDCRGKGSPTVVLESGLDAFGSLSWAAVHDDIAKTTRVCAYSRAGILWSDPTSSNTVDSQQVVQDLHTALTEGGETTPWVMVGHSLGGLYNMTFTSLYESEVAGLVFVDASHPDQFEPMKELTGISLADIPSSVIPLTETLARIGVLRGVHAMSPPLPNVPPLVHQVSQAYSPQNVGSLLKTALSVEEEAAAAGEFRQLGDRPIVVLTGTQSLSSEMLQQMGISQEQEIQRQDLWKQFHTDQATWSTRSRHELVPDASHYIQFDRPDVVIKAVREVVMDVRESNLKNQ